MRKFFTLLTMCLLATSLWAAEITFDYSVDTGNAGSTASAYQVSKEGVTMSVSNGLINGHYRVYKGQTVTFASTIGDITKIEFQCTASGDAQYGPGCFTCPIGTYTYAEKVGTWEGGANEVAFTASTAQVRFTKVIVTVGAATLSAPAITPAAGTYYDPIQVSITCPTSGAKIYYTTNGSDPTTASAQYSAPFTVSSNTTVKAISAKDGEVSTVTSAAYEFATATAVANIAAFQGVADGTAVKFSNPVNALAHNKNYLYVMDNSGYALIYGSNIGQTYKNGDVIPAGFVGTKTTYAGEPELQALNGFQAATGNSPIAPENITANLVSHNLFAHYVYMENVTISTEDNKNYTLTDEDGNTCAVYFGSMGVSAPSDLTVAYDVTGVVGSYGKDNTVYQLLPVILKKHTNPGEGFGWGNMASTADNEMVTFDYESTVIAQSGNYLYAMDETGYGLAYGSVGKTYKAGDVIPAGFGGKKTTYNAEPELAATLSGFEAATRNVDIHTLAKEVAVTDVNHEHWAWYVLLKQVKFDTANGKIIDKNGNSCNLFNGRFNITLPSGDDYCDVYGVIDAYGKTNTVYQVLPIEISGLVIKPTDVKNIEELYALSQGTQGQFTTALTAIYQNGSNLYVKDVDGTYGLVYGTVADTFVNGDYINGAIASWTTYSGNKQMTPAGDSFVKAGHGEEVAPEEMPIEEISQDMVHTYFYFDGVQIVERDGNMYIVDDTDEMMLYNRFKVEMPEISADKTYDVWGFLTIYKEEREFYQTRVVEHGAQTYAPEDVNHDGEVNIADVNAVIDAILTGTSVYNCDANQDGEVNIADVNAVIDYILKH